MVELTHTRRRGEWRRSSSPNLQHAHHAFVLMLENVAVIHPLPWVIVEVNENANR